jgi:hypothetical protein|tara:strand:+ start:553 stop:912 length:360 start_codon:yes stop_codon:yes gene_type:complete
MDNLTESNLLLYAAKHYYNPRFSDIDEFYEDLKRFKYVKRLVNRYLDDKDLSERLILNHLIVIFNAFGIEPSVNMLKVKLDERHWPVIKPFLIFLKYISYEDLVGINMDEKVIEELRKI